MKNRQRPVSVTLGWDLKPTLVFSDGKIYSRKAENLLYSDYYPNGEIWPIDPDTGEKIPQEVIK